MSNPEKDAFLGRLPAHYFDRFDAETQALHLTRLCALSDTTPMQYLFSDAPDGTVSITVLSYNYDYVFSLITGALSAQGFHILSGEAFTYTAVPAERYAVYGESGVHYRWRQGIPRKIIDVFTGRITDPIAIHLWKQQLLAFMDDLFAALSHAQLEEAIAMVNRAVVQRLVHIPQRVRQLIPIHITLDNDLPNVTRLTVVTQDTPMFLYAISHALAMQGLSIEHLTIGTEGTRVEDVFEIVDNRGLQIINTDVLDQIRLSTLLTKQFTYFLDRAPNPYDALSRFGTLLKSIADVPEKSQWLRFFSDSRALSDIARLLGTSDSLWEDVIRVHLDALLPVLSARMQNHPVYDGEDSLFQRLTEAVMQSEDKKEALNRFKDQEMFLIDLNHILGRSEAVVFSRQLTRLVENVLRVAIELVWAELVSRYGPPMGFGDLPASWVLMGLGKLGGEALGYASDIELMLIYSDMGQTSGIDSVANDHFFALFVQGLTHYIVGKRDGIFEIDLRLRPYGQDGPLAVHLTQFCQYFGGGAAHSYEKLSLVRMRTIAGNATFGKKVLRLRDQYVYHQPFAFEELWALRRRQHGEKVQAQLNLKYSPGALVDLEYTVQMLQVMHAKKHPRLKTPYIHKALGVLGEIGVMPTAQSDILQRAYLFFREVINGLRMLRGSANDLELPELGSPEFDFLAKRIGTQGSDRVASQQLFSEIQTFMAAVRTFVEHYFRDVLPGDDANIADLIFAKAHAQTRITQILTPLGFKNTQRAYHNLMALAARATDKARFAQLAVLAAGYLTEKSDPDMALNNWERLVSVLSDPDTHFSLLMRQPSRLDIMMDLFSVSQFLSDAVIRDPDSLHWATEPHRLKRCRKRGELTVDLTILSQNKPDEGEWFAALRHFRRRELLRIAIKDISLQVSLQEVTQDISLLAEALCQVALTRAIQIHMPIFGRDTLTSDGVSEAFCLLAMGKLGATELNYSSDIDLIPVYDAQLLETMGVSDSEARLFFSKVLHTFQTALTAYTDEGRVYRMDFNLRPYGASGEWVTSRSQLLDYYRHTASLWEIQALLKMRPLAGSWAVGFSFLYDIYMSQKAMPAEQISASIIRMRAAAIKKLNPKRLDVKNGLGGIRDIEFLVQGIQLQHITTTPIRIRSTLGAINHMQRLGLLPVDICQILRDHYILFRRLEHFLQLFEDQQVHALPDNPVELQILAKRLFGENAEGDALRQKLVAAMEKIAGIRKDYLG